MPELRYGKAIGQALHDAMTGDPNVVVFGEDIAGAGGSFGVTRGLLDSFGPLRVRDTPISEATILSAAVGAAMGGLRPVVEIMFMDFITLGMDALVNQAAKARFMFGGQTSVPMVLRTPHGGGLAAGPQHSQCLEGWLAHVPGLKVVCPATVADAYGLMRAAIDDPDPVIFIEHKALYAHKGELTEPPAPVPIGRAATARPGRDLTIVTWGAALHEALAAAGQLAGRGIEAEVIDLRSLQPWDEGAVLDSLRRTHRLVVFHEAVTAYGPGAEIAARLGEIGFDELDAPIVRVGAPFMPVPFAPSLENAYRPQAGDLVAAAERVLA
ncbi:alpha-ketoacid dehydrogenase subunit beta [Immundisolibacter sp.]|uniref:alpha-ketoacid dehydrogenase subunit beta n=1 Tax=Immundisolibacter sp. TaxID=1934948 RepID=UPI003F8724FA